MDERTNNLLDHGASGHEGALDTKEDESHFEEMVREAGRFYRAHLLFLRARDPSSASAREQFETFAFSIRELLARRWANTTEHYEREQPKCVYYLSLEYLIGRSLANNVANLLLDQLARELARREHLEWPKLLEQEPDAGLGNGGLGRLAACFLDSMATLELPAMGYGLRYEYGMFRRVVRPRLAAARRRTLGCASARILGNRAPSERVEVKFGCGIEELREGRLRIHSRSSRRLLRGAVRSPGDGLWHPYDQHAEAVGGSCA